MEDTVLLLQHTRVVPRKKIEVASCFATCWRTALSKTTRANVLPWLSAATQATSR
ncbi:MAG: hypothetical protein U5L09_03690 [Bacteroidales bacterium]|nr:hypothetical protein [Bacteroidales bacterium]